MAGNETDSEKDAIEELRKIFKDEVNAEMYEDKRLFYRFLKARDFNIQNAEKMLRKHLQWRKEKDIDSILKNYKPNEVLEKYYSNSLICHDKEGSPVRYVPLGSMDLRGMNMCANVEDYCYMYAHDCEEEVEDMAEQSRKLGKLVEQTVYIYNFENFSLATATDRTVISTNMALLKMFESNYPEHLKAAYAINTSYYFYLFYNILKPFVVASMLKKIRIFPKDGWKEELLKIIDEDQLPAFLGGKRTDPDGSPLCLTIIKQGGKVPKSYYKSKKKIKTLQHAPGVEKLTIARSRTKEIKLEVLQPGSCLSWEFETKYKDIGFGIFYIDEDSDKKTKTYLIPMKRVDDEHTESGMVVCNHKGIYTMVFDNSYSWWRAKEIYLKKSVLDPLEQQ